MQNITPFKLHLGNYFTPQKCSLNFSGKNNIKTKSNPPPGGLAINDAKKLFRHPNAKKILLKKAIKTSLLVYQTLWGDQPMPLILHHN